MLGKCVICGQRSDLGGHKIMVMAHDRKSSATWPLGWTTRAITNMACREVRDGEVLSSRMVPVATIKGRRFIVVDQWLDDRRPSHVVFVPSEIESAPDEVKDRLLGEGDR